jgi:hypothetical protein
MASADANDVALPEVQGGALCPLGFGNAARQMRHLRGRSCNGNWLELSIAINHAAVRNAFLFFAFLFATLPQLSYSDHFANKRSPECPNPQSQLPGLRKGKRLPPCPAIPHCAAEGPFSPSGETDLASLWRNDSEKIAAML